MAEEIETLLIGVRADTAGFARDVADMRGQLEGPLAAGTSRAGQSIESALLKAVRTGKLGFDDLKRAALSVMAEIAASALKTGIGSLGGGSGGGGGLIATASSLLSALLGAPGRATGGPVVPGRPYLIGERGPEWFVPTASGRIETGAPAGSRDIRMNININAPAGTEPKALAQSSRQVARAVKAALMKAD